MDERGFAYQPALDGLRALAVMLVLCFHAGFGWMRGGYVGVSIFFTLSGYLITSVMLGGIHRGGGARPLPFVARRVKRLLPASLLCLGLVVVARSLGQFASAPDFGHELRAALTSTFNWTRAVGDRSYVDALAATSTHQSPFEHFWSLAVEEQFYLVWPFAIAAVVALTHRRGRDVTRRLTVAIVAATVVALAGAPLLAHLGGAELAYWATPVRAAEILVGACLALVTRPAGRWVHRMAWVALLVLLAAAVWLPSGSGPAYHGWMAPLALASAVLIRGIGSGSHLGAVFALAPLVALGQISYGVYLFHWPVFLLVRQHGGDLTSPPVFLLTCAAVVGIAWLSFRLVEQPIRRTSLAPRRVVAMGLAVLLAAFVATPMVAGGRGFLEADRRALAQASAGDAPTDTAPLQAASPTTSTTTTWLAPTAMTPHATSRPVAAVDAADTATTTPLPPTVATTAPPTTEPTMTSPTTGPPTTSPPFPTDLAVPAPANRPVRVLTVGDSTGFYVGQALAQWAVAHPQLMRSDLLWCQGCGFVLDGTIIGWDAAKFVRRSNQVVHQDIPAAVRKLRPDVVLLMVTLNDAADREWSTDEGPLTPADPRFLERMTASYQAITQQLLDLGVPRVVWVDPPVPHWHGEPASLADPTRWATMDAAIDAVAATIGPPVGVLDVDGLSRAAGRADDEAWRPDGVHLTEASASELVDRWLAAALLDEVMNVPRT